ncbi:hypothetical protein ACQB60_28295 [Actinomycetota bacterium Odt1-20B]
MGEHVKYAERAGLPVHGGAEEEPEAGADLAGHGGGRAARLLGRRGHALGVGALVAATVGFGVPLWSELRARVLERVEDAPDGAIGIGTAVAWCTSVLANIVTLGVLGFALGALGAVALRLRFGGDGGPAPEAAGSGGFTRVRRAFTLGWIAFVLAKLTGWTLVRLALGDGISRAVPSVTLLDGWLVLLPCALAAAGRIAGAGWPRAAAAAAGVTAVYATALLLLPS